MMTIVNLEIFIFCVWCLIVGVTLNKIEVKSLVCKIKECQQDEHGHPNLVHISSSNSSHSVQFVVSTIGTPMIFFGATENQVIPKLRVVNWAKLLTNQKDSISFDPPLKATHGFAFLNLLEFDDIEDVADITKIKNDSITVRPMQDFNWELLNDTSDFKNYIIRFVSNVNSSLHLHYNGTFSFQVKIAKSDGRINYQPGLQYTPSSLVVNVSLDNLLPQNTSSRYALEIAAFSSQKTDMSSEQLSSIDDEFSPGVFRINNYLGYNPAKTPFGGYMQWRPVCYTDKDHIDRQHFSKALMNDNGEQSTASLRNTVAHALLGQEGLKSSSLKSFTISFGLPKDKFYRATNYTLWSFTAGFGNPPVERISLFVIIVIASGLGIPVLIIVFGGIFVFTRKRLSRDRGPTTAMVDPTSSGYSTFTDHSVNA